MMVGGGEEEEATKAKKTAHEKLSRYKDSIEWVEKFSPDAIEDINEKLDFVYIDGNHDYEFVKEDIRNYYPLVKDNGIIGGHDFPSIGVCRAVIEFCEKNGLIDKLGVKGREWWVKKSSNK